MLELTGKCCDAITAVEFFESLAEGGAKREEVLWLNYADAQLSFEADFPEVMS